MPWTKATSACVKSCAGAEAACAGRRALIRPAQANATASRGAAERRVESDMVAMGCADGLAGARAPADLYGQYLMVVVRATLTLHSARRDTAPGRLASTTMV